MIRRLLGIVALFMLLKDTSAAGDYRVKNGALARLGKFPAVVLLTSRPDRSGSIGMCTGTIVEDDLIITAAHCVCGEESPVELVLPGVLSLDDQGAEYPTSNRAIHPTIEPTCRRDKKKAFGEHDLAILQTGRNIQTDRNIAKTTFDFSNKGGSQTLTIVGYGLDERGKSGVLKEGTLQTMPNCEAMGSHLSAICYDASPAANWQVSGSGDSGCAAIDGQNRIVGINSGKLTSTISGGRMGYQEKEYGVMASVAANKDFIQSAIKRLRGGKEVTSFGGDCAPPPPPPSRGGASSSSSSSGPTSSGGAGSFSPSTSCPTPGRVIDIPITIVRSGDWKLPRGAGGRIEIPVHIM